MAPLAYLDTHLMIWLHSKELMRFNKKVLEVLDSHLLFISPMVMLELQYLFEIEKLAYKPNEIFHDLQKEIGLELDEQCFNQVIIEAMKFFWTRDPFDRIITATASVRHSPLITADKLIRKHYAHAIW